MKTYLLASAFTLIALPAAAATFSSGHLYAGIGGGLILPQDIDVSVSGAITGNGEISFDNGYQFGGFLGYHFTPMIAGELQVDYASADYDQVSGTLGGTSGSFDVNGDISAWTGFMNVLITPPMDKFHPFIGGGIGLASYHDEINSVTIGGVTTAVNSDNDDTSFAADGIVGFDYAFTKNFSLGARYQHMWVDSGSSETSGGIMVKTGDANIDAITARATWKF